jgi:hypothetical protein
MLVLVVDLKRYVEPGSLPMLHNRPWAEFTSSPAGCRVWEKAAVADLPRSR